MVWNLVDTITKQIQHLVLTITDTLKLLIISYNCLCVWSLIGSTITDDKQLVEVTPSNCFNRTEKLPLAHELFGELLILLSTWMAIQGVSANASQTCNSCSTRLDFDL